MMMFLHIFVLPSPKYKPVNCHLMLTRYKAQSDNANIPLFSVFKMVKSSNL